MEVEVASSLAQVDPEAWNALVDAHDPFTEYAFLRLLETSGSVGRRRTGWQPCHLLLKHRGELLGAMPLYLKHHSYGEFIFDFGWAQAAYRAGIEYYPKLTSAVPLTPVTGKRLLTHPAHAAAPLARALIDAARELTRALEASSLHVLFCTAEERTLLRDAGLADRLSYQYHLIHDGAYRDFDAFTAALRNASRKQVRRERKQAQAYGFTFSMRRTTELPAQDLEAMWEFYNQTIANYGSEPYLTRAFFDGLAQAPHAYAAMAHDGEEPVAGALFFHKGEALYGRYWGTRRELPMLHFELCYYFPIEWGLARGMRRFEAGAQGEQKIKRGLLPNACHSAHWAVHPGLHRAIAAFVENEADYVRREMAMMQASTPFKRGGEDAG